VSDELTLEVGEDVQPLRRKVREQVLEIRLLVRLEAEMDDGRAFELVEILRSTSEDGQR
jgi:hypothetical protein